MWNSGPLDYSELPNILLRDVEREYFAKRTEKSKIHASLMDKEVKTGMIMAVPNFKISLMKRGFARVTLSDTLHFAERKAELFGNWIMHHLKL